MKNLKIGVLTLFCGLCLTLNAYAKELTLGIAGMTCQACIDKVTDKLMAIDGVNKVDINLDKKTANLDVEDNMYIPEKVVESAITAAGFNYTGGEGFADMIPQEMKDAQAKAEEVNKTSKSWMNMFGGNE